MPFVKGDPNINRKGYRPHPEIELLRKAVKTVEKEEKRSVYEEFVRQAFKNPRVLIALMKKLVPDMVKSEITGANDMPLIPIDFTFEATIKKEEEKKINE